MRRSIRVTYILLIGVVLSGAVLCVVQESPLPLAGQLVANAPVLAGLAAVLMAFAHRYHAPKYSECKVRYSW